MINPLLDRIVAQTRADLDGRRRAPTRPNARVGRAPCGLTSALSRPQLSLIAEIKPRSPSRGDLRSVEDLGPVLSAYRERAQAISVLIDKTFFGGGLELLKTVRTEVDLPLLAKGFLLEAQQVEEAFLHGADGVLLIVRLLDPRTLSRLLKHTHSYGMDALVEVHTDDELSAAVDAGARIIGVNARDLDTLSINLKEARRRLDKIPQGILRVAESGLETRADIDQIRSLANAALIGTAFMSAPNVDEAIEALGW